LSLGISLPRSDKIRGKERFRLFVDCKKYMKKIRLFGNGDPERTKITQYLIEINPVISKNKLTIFATN
jgi:hypothetical protein